MDTLEFISSLVDALAWPLALVVVLYLFRGTIKELLSGQLESLGAGPLKAKWKRLSAETRSHLAPATRTDYSHVPAQPSLQNELRLLVEEAPLEAVLEAHRQLEQALRAKVASAVPDEDLDQLTAVQLVRRGRELGRFNDETVRAVEGVAVLRDLAVHGPLRTISRGRALEYLSLVEAVLYAVNAPTPPDPPEG